MAKFGQIFLEMIANLDDNHFGYKTKIIKMKIVTN
jgi:hypothetical protein